MFGAVAIVWYVALTLISPGDVLANSILALGFGIAFYYGLTGFACVFYYRRHIFRSFKNFIFIGLAPLLGALILTILFVVAIFYYSDPANSNSGNQAWLPFIHFNFTFLHQHFYVKKGLGSTAGARDRAVAHRRPAHADLDGPEQGLLQAGT